MKKTLVALLAVCAVSAHAQTPLFIKGTMDIKFNASFDHPGEAGFRDVYMLNINVDNSVVFHGKIQDQPQLITGWVSKGITQPRRLTYDVDCDVVNPKNTAQTLNVGSMHGTVPILPDGTYFYNSDNDPLVIDILPRGNAGGFTGKFRGTASGHPLNRPASFLDTLQCETVNITRQINGKTSTVTLTKYDKMTFNNTVLAEGPVQFYQPVTVNGEMLYDYKKKCWFLNNMTAQYYGCTNGIGDKLSGTIRWVPDANRKSNGQGEYDFDVRVNEPIPNPDSAFAAPADESSFFDSNNTTPGLVGTMKYKDTLPLADDDSTTHSAVTIDLTGSNISKQQLIVLFKVIVLQSIVPMNSN